MKLTLGLAAFQWAELPVDRVLFHCEARDVSGMRQRFV